VAEVEKTAAKLRVVALKRGVNPITLIPDASTRIEPDDLLVVIGDRASVKDLSA
jgi:Trk K+ transport system NAD-binding subunit